MAKKKDYVKDGVGDFQANRKTRLYRSSVEKYYGWKERKDLIWPGHPLMLGLLEIWFMLPAKGRGVICDADLSPAGLRAVKKLRQAQWMGWIG